MNKIYVRLASFLIAGTVLFETVPVSAVTPSAGVTGFTSNIMNNAALPVAGVSAALSENMATKGNEAIAADALGDAELFVEKEYNNVAIANVKDYVYVRAEASSDSEYVGKLYNKNAAEILETLDGWYKIKSGKIEGYVSADYVVVGDEEYFNSATKRKAKVETASLRVRSESNTDADVIKKVAEGDVLEVLSEEEDGWIQVRTDAGDGYVSEMYVNVYTKYTSGETKEAEQARIAAEEAAKRAEEARIAAEKEAARKAAEKAAAAKKKKSSSGTKAAGSKTGKAVANYACQFIGNPYVWGGTSLTKGADCSGFVMAVYKKFGVSLPHSSTAMRKVGKKVDPSAMAPGDIVCYKGHVGIYVGGGKMVNASSKKTGIKYTNVHYRTIVAVRRIF